MKNFNEWLSTRYPGAKIIKLADLAEKIVGVSKVRVTDNRTITDYCEVSLENIKNGIVTIPDETNKFGPANASALKQQSLQVSDLVLSRRPRLLTIGLVDKVYDRPIIANNGMIRITFPEDRKKYIPLFVLEYLKTPQVQQYLETLSSGSKPLLSAKTLAELPIPIFNENELKILIHEIEAQKKLEYELNIMNESKKELDNLTSSLIADALFTSSERFDTSHILHKLQNINKDIESTLHDMRLLNKNNL